MAPLDTQTLMFANATVAGALAAMAFVYARGQASARLVARGWGWLMTAFAAASFAWFVNETDTLGVLGAVGNTLFALIPSLGLAVLGRLADRPVLPGVLLALAAPGVVGVLLVSAGAPRYFASIPIGAAFVLATAASLGLLVLQQRKRPSLYQAALLLTLLVVVVVCTARLIAASTGFHALVVPLANSVIQTLTVLAGTLFITAGSVSVFGMLEERRLAKAVEDGEHDGLTGLLLRKPFLQRSASVIEQQASTAFSVVLLDLDYFKSINDRHGHAAGDAVIKDCAGVLNDCVRDGDLTARLGGEEFVVMLPRCSSEEAQQVAQRVLRSIRDRRVLAPNGQLLLYTASVGVAHVPIVDNGDVHAILRVALGRADEALYEAKRGGRDRVVISASHRSDVSAAARRGHRVLT